MLWATMCKLCGECCGWVRFQLRPMLMPDGPNCHNSSAVAAASRQTVKLTVHSIGFKMSHQACLDESSSTSCIRSWQCAGLSFG